MASYLLMVASSALEGRAEAYNAWYDGEHLPDLLKIPGIANARRYDAAPQSPMPAPADYLAVYELDTEDPIAVLAELRRRVAADEISTSPDIDRASVRMWLYKPR